MSGVPRTEHRVVRSSDPSLSPEANRVLTDEVRAIIGRDEVDVPATRPDPAHDARGGHSPWIADVIDARLGPVFAGLVAIVVAAIVALTWGGWAIVVATLVVLIGATLLAARVLLGLTGEAEHPDPETAALREAEGVGDPDRVLQQLVDEFRPADGDAPSSCLAPSPTETPSHA